ncbi:MAG: hypothetical protein H6740_00945 [Alphaproteobacteria bacterium]|nr:hypothetical protein [Alphaproteobacteria bacterium]
MPRPPVPRQKPRTRPPPPPVHVYARQIGDRMLYCLSLLNPTDVVAAGGLHRAAILGTSSDPHRLSADSFLPNPLFLDLLFEVVEDAAPGLHTLQRRAVFARRGTLRVWDGRSRGRTSPDAQADVLGTLEVREGRIQGHTFLPNPDYSPLSDRGLMRLPPGLLKPLMERLRELRVPLVRAPGEH